MTGFCAWKKAHDRFKSHENSAGHKEDAYKFAQKNQPTINAQVNKQHSSDQIRRQGSFIKQLGTLRVLLRQGLAVRGHDDKESNFHQFLTLRCDDDPDLQKWLHDNKYQSPEIINECMGLLSNELLRNFLKDIRDAQIFAVLADETRDISNKEQLSICIRWVDQDFVIHEDLIGMIHVVHTDAESLYLAIRDVLLRCGLPISQCRGQGYDGAAAMMGHLRGVAKRFQDDEHRALPVHCFAHSLNLCLQDATKMCNIIRDSLSLVKEIHQLLSNSPKRNELFNEIKVETCPDAPGLRPLCSSRWTVRTSAIESILKIYEALLDTVDEINMTAHDEHGAKAGKFCQNSKNLEHFLGLK